MKNELNNVKFKKMGNSTSKDKVLKQLQEQNVQFKQVTNGSIYQKRYNTNKLNASKCSTPRTKRTPSCNSDGSTKTVDNMRRYSLTSHEVKEENSNNSRRKHTQTPNRRIQRRKNNGLSLQNQYDNELNITDLTVNTDSAHNNNSRQTLIVDAMN